MFADSILEPRNSSRSIWALLLSVAVQSLGLAVMVAIPLIYSDSLQPRVRAATLMPVRVNPLAEAPPTGPASGGGNWANPLEVMQGNFTYRPHGETDLAPEPPRISGAAFATGLGPNLFDSGPSVVRGPEAKPVVPKAPLRVSTISEGNLLQRVQPIYPIIAKQTGVSGQVVLSAVISRSGAIESLHVVSGHPFLLKAALDAVRQWRYRPYLLNGEAIEVETQITVNFKLGS